MLDITGYRASIGSRHDGRPHAIVIGSGFGGLAAAIRLGARGYRVTVLEKLDMPGGRACVYRQDGFTFDAGPTIVTAPFLFEELWAMCGRRFADDIDLRPVSPFYRIRFHDGDTFDYSGDPDAMEREILRIAPDDLAGYRAFMAVSEATYRAGFERLGHVPFGSIADMIRILPDLAAAEMLPIGPWRSRASCAQREAASGAELPSAPDRRQPVQRHVDLLPDRVPGTRIRRAFCHGRNRNAGCRHGAADRRAGRLGPLQRAGAPDRGRSWRSDWRRTGRRQFPAIRHRHFKRRFRNHLPDIWSIRNSASAGPTARSIAHAIR